MFRSPISLSDCLFFLTVEFRQSYILDTDLLSGVSFANIFCQSVACFHSPNSNFGIANVLNFNIITYFLLWILPSIMHV